MKRKPDLEAVYRKTPIPLQNLVVSLEGWRISSRRYNRGFFQILAAIRDGGTDSRPKLEDLWRERLHSLLLKAQVCPYWNRQFQEYGIEARDTHALLQLEKLPILTKDAVKANLQDIAAPGIPGADLITCHTSGTTGSGLVFPVKKSAERLQWATWWRYRNWHQINLDTWCGYFGGRSLVSVEQQKPPFWRINYPGRQLMFSAYHLKDETAADYVSEIIARKIPWLHGYPSTLSLLAKFKLDQRLPDCPHLKIITTGAENLLPHQKTLMEKAFGVPVRQHYGQAEGVANISECEQGRLHVDEDFSYVEFIPITGEDNLFRIIGTNWANEAFPLLRYDTGDIAVLDDGECSCGRPGRIVRRIDGRQEDFVILPSGARVGRLDHIFKDMPRIREAQILQLKDGSVRLRIVPDQDYDRTRDEGRLLEEARMRLGKELDLSVEYLEKLPRTASGKLRFVISELPSAKIVH
jgi:phenylacetate-CoA ligase